MMLVGHYDPTLVALSVAIAILASYTALDLASRVGEHQASSRRTWSWLIAGAVAMGGGIWAMHFIGMLAFSLPIPMAYDGPLTVLSLLIAIVVSALALFILRRPTVPRSTLAVGATLMGFGIAAMHYTGMAAMQMFPAIRYDPTLVVASVVIAILASAAALGIAVALRTHRSRLVILAKVGSAVVMGLAIAGMHYTGMAAAHFAPGSICRAVHAGGVAGPTLALIVGSIALLILVTTLVLSAMDGFFANHNALLAASLRLARDEAEAALRENRAITLELRAAQSQLLGAARKAGMAEIATNVLHNVGNVLNSVSVSAALISTRIRDSKITGVLQSIELLQQHAADITDFLTDDPKGQRLLPYLHKLAPMLAAERTTVLEETAALLRSVEHITEIVAQQQAHAGSQVIAEAVDIAALLDDALRMSADSMARHGITVVREIAAAPEVLLDKHLLLQIFVNLISNATQAMRAAPGRPHRLVVRVQHESASSPQRLRVSIEDDGDGIAAGNLAHLFEHGFTTRAQGHGFGLHSSAIAARALGGTLSAHSEGVGLGARFVLELPARPARTGA